MRALKVVGGILAAVGAGLILVVIINWLIEFGPSITIFLASVLPILALIGGIFAIAGKRAGGILALIVGIVWIGFAIYFHFGSVFDLPFELYCLITTDTSFFVTFFGITVWDYITIESILVFVGGILALVGGSDK